MLYITLKISKYGNFSVVLNDPNGKEKYISLKEDGSISGYSGKNEDTVKNALEVYYKTYIILRRLFKANNLVLNMSDRQTAGFFIKEVEVLSLDGIIRNIELDQTPAINNKQLLEYKKVGIQNLVDL